MADLTRLNWAWRRISRMTPVEMAYRVLEQAKRLADRWRRPPWSAFGDFLGGVEGLPVLDPYAAGPGVRIVLHAEAEEARAGRFAHFGQRWPPPAQLRPSWWDSDFWLIDPVSGRNWPGAERFAFDIDHRHNNALGDVKFVWELNRLQFLPLLAMHAALSGDEAVAADLFAMLRGWMRANPPHRGVNWTSGIEAASRMVSLLAALSFVRPRTGEDEQAVRHFLHGHFRWIARYPSRFSSANNHRVAELTALFAASLCSPGLPGSAHCLRRAQAELEREMLRQFHPDGFGAEQSLDYAAYCLEWFALAGMIGAAKGRSFSKAFKDRARLAMDALRWTLDSAGRTPRIGDSDDGRVLALTQAAEPGYIASVVAMAARWLGAPTLKSDPALRDLLGDPPPVAPSLSGTKTFSTGGLTVWRRPRPDGDLLLAFDHGPLGHLAIAAHGHADALAVWLHWGEEAVLVDPGTYLYHSQDGLRDALRGTRAHNTLALADKEQSRIVGPFAWSDHARADLVSASEQVLEAEHDGYRRWFGLIHRRRVQVDDNAIWIEDRLLGRPKTPRLPWSVGFTLAPEATVKVDGQRADLVTPAGRRLSMLAEATDGSSKSWVVVRTPYAPAFGLLGSTFRLEQRGHLGGAPLVSRIRIELGRRHQNRPT